MAKSIGISEELIVNKIYQIRGQKVMLDKDLAEMYGVETRVFNQSIKPNQEPLTLHYGALMGHYKIKTRK